MKTEIKIKSLVFGLSIIAANYLTAQTTQTPTDTVKNNTTTQAATGTNNPEIEALKQKISANPNDTEALVGLATAYQNANDWTSAIETWKKITTLLPDWSPAYYSIGYANQSAKNNAGAKAAYEQYITKVKPAEIEASKQNLAYAYFFIAFQDKDTDKEKAKQYIAKSLQYDGSNQDALALSKSLMN